MLKTYILDFSLKISILYYGRIPRANDFIGDNDIEIWQNHETMQPTIIMYHMGTIRRAKIVFWLTICIKSWVKGGGWLSTVTTGNDVWSRPIQLALYLLDHKTFGKPLRLLFYGRAIEFQSLKLKCKCCCIKGSYQSNSEYSLREMSLIKSITHTFLELFKVMYIWLTK